MSEPKQIGKKFAFIFWGLLLAFFYFLFEDQLKAQYNPNENPETYSQGNQQVLVLQRNRQGHYVTSGQINGQRVVFMLDTGATTVAVPKFVADEIGLRFGAPISVNTANGVATAYQTRIEQLSIGEIQLENVKASIVPGMLGEDILLGMSVLKQVEFSQRGDQLTLRKSQYN
jgi:aspartyl protease family protein